MPVAKSNPRIAKAEKPVLAKLAAKRQRLDPGETFKAVKQQYPKTLSRLAE